MFVLLFQINRLTSSPMNSSSRKKVVVGISGGVDSAVSAYLLKKQGYNVLGVYMWCYGSHDEKCRAHQDRADAVKIASRLNISFEVWDFEKEYSEKVLKYFYNEYDAGRTPNPDVVCNKEIKFGLFYNKAIKELGYDYIATGHYARILTEAGNWKLEARKEARSLKLDKSKSSLQHPVSTPASSLYLLASGLDLTKDQSYFLYRLKPEQLPHILFPVGNLIKQKVRKIAKEAGLPVFNKPDSQGICFVGEFPLRDFLKGKVNYSKGNVEDTKGEVIGFHDGLPFYTIGQRRGFTLTKYQGLPMFVIGKNSEKNTLVVGCGKETEVSSFKVGEINWLVPGMEDGCWKMEGRWGEVRKLKFEKNNPTSSIQSLNPSSNFQHQLSVRIRHLGKLIPCNLEIEKERNLAQLRCELSIPQRGVASGQSAVFYSGDIVVAGGVIL